MNIVDIIVIRYLNINKCTFVSFTRKQNYIEYKYYVIDMLAKKGFWYRHISKIKADRLKEKW